MPTVKLVTEDHVVGLFNQMNKLADGYQIEPDVLPGDWVQ